MPIVRASDENLPQKTTYQAQLERQLPEPIARVGLLLTLMYWLTQSAYDAWGLHLGSFVNLLVPEQASLLHGRLFAVIAILLVTYFANKIISRPRPLIMNGEQHAQEEVTFLNRTAMELIDLPLEEDIYEYIGERIKELVGNGVVFVNAYDDESDSLRVRSLLGAGTLVEAAVRALGRHPVGLSFDLTERARQGISQGILEKAEGGLYEACFGKINEEICHRLEYIAGIDEVYGIGLARKGGIFGDVLIITRKGNPNLNCGVIEAFSNQASVALHRRKAEEELRGLSLVDELTGLYNRRGFLTLAEQQLKIACRMMRPMYLLFVDLDYLKWINDTHGHAEGDKAINEVGRIMKRNFRDSDIVARMGGDEFAVLVVEPGDAPPELFTERLLSSIESRNTCEGNPYPLAMSIGIETFDPMAPCTLNELLQRADLAMYEKKRSREKSPKARA